MTTPANPTDRPVSGSVAAAPTTGRPSVTIVAYPDYPSAQRVVDYLSDNQFPVEHTAIVGTDVRLVEKVLGRVTIGRAALAGAGGGAWFGLLIGLVVSLFATSDWWRIMLTGLVIGAIWGGVFGAIAHAATGGRRDFASRSALEAGQYAVTVDAEHADQARQLLTRLTWQSSGAS